MVNPEQLEGKASDEPDANVFETDKQAGHIANR